MSSPYSPRARSKATQERASARSYRGANGNYGEEFVTSTAGLGWVTVTARLPRSLEAPITFVSLRLADLNTSQLRNDGSLFFDEFVAVNAAGDRTVLENFEDEFRWTMYSAQGKERNIRTQYRSREERPTVRPLDLEKAVSPTERILAPNDPTGSCRSLMNAPAMGAFATGPGGIAIASIEEILIPFSVRGKIEMFPTLQPEVGIVVVNYDHFRSLAATVLHFELAKQNEIWVDFAETTSIEDQQAIVAALSPQSLSHRSSAQPPATAAQPAARRIILRPNTAGFRQRHPHRRLHLRARPLTLGFVVTLVLSARSRTVEFAVLRVVGTSARQILRSLLLEWGTVLMIGAVVGVLLGRQVARIMLSFLEVTDQGVPVLPPFVLLTDWTTLGIGIGVLAGLVLVSLGLAWATTMRRANASELRITPVAVSQSRTLLVDLVALVATPAPEARSSRRHPATAPPPRRQPPVH